MSTETNTTPTSDVPPPSLPGRTWHKINPERTSRYEYLADHIEAGETASGFVYHLMTTATGRNGEILRIPADIDDHARWSRIHIRGAEELRTAMDQIRVVEGVPGRSAAPDATP
ncbi:hypothetical protein ABTY59_31945 [Streptomyces sp. NPDC096079]|uniref:hypothetical protein n=1 Tax=Streptomyces sp. NPDC096079 TaxID=3155820 RepID=UPI003318D3A7